MHAHHDTKCEQSPVEDGDSSIVLRDESIADKVRLQTTIRVEIRRSLFT